MFMRVWDIIQYNDRAMNAGMNNIITPEIMAMTLFHLSQHDQHYLRTTSSL